MKEKVETIQERLNQRGDRELDRHVNQQFGQFRDAFWLNNAKVSVEDITSHAYEGMIGADYLVRLIETAVRKSHAEQYRDNATKAFLEDVENAKNSIDEVLANQ